MSERSDHPWLMPFAAGVLAGGAALVLSRALRPRRGLDPRLIRRAHASEIPPVVIVPGIMGSALVRPDGVPAWLNMGNALGYHNLALPYTVPLADSRDDLLPGGLIGTEDRLPRMFGFTEYADLVELLEAAGFQPTNGSPGLAYTVFGYDWRRDLVESARRLEETLDALAEARGEPHARFNLVGHSMGGLLARYYLRYGTAEPGPEARVTWAGARRIRNLVVVASPSGGSIPALQGLLVGNRVGLSSTTLSADVVSRMPSVYQLLPPAGTYPLVDEHQDPIHAGLHEVETWRRFGWGPFVPREVVGGQPRDAQAAFLETVLARARDFHAALARRPESPCPARVVVLGGDCLPTLARCVVPARPGAAPRFEPLTRAETEVLYEAGDGRVTRASVIGAHVPGAEHSDLGCGLPEVSASVFGFADHHGIYAEPTFQSLLLRVLLRSPGLAPLFVPSRRTAERPLAVPLPGAPLLAVPGEPQVASVEGAVPASGLP